jgi:hypothetical protein
MDQHFPPEHEFKTGRSHKRQTLNSVSGCFVRLLLLLFAILGTFRTVPANASGSEITKREHDLVVTIDTRWAGGSQGGYYPIRIRLVNRGKSRTLTFRFESGSDSESMPTVLRRNIAADQNATVQFTLSVPLVSAGSDGVLQVEENGSLLKGLSTRMRLPEPDDHALARPSLLVISPNQDDCRRFDAAVQGLSTGGGSTGAMGVFSASSSYSTESDYEVIPPTLLPDSWIDYTPVDLVAISLQTLETLGRQKRSAILKWVDCGGTLLITNVGSPAAQSKILSRLLGLDNSTSADKEWQPANLAFQNAPQKVKATVDGEAILQNLGKAVIEGVVSGKDPRESLESLAQEVQSKLASHVAAGQQEVEWPSEPETFNRRERMLGLVFAFQGDPFPGSVRDWNWLFNSIGANQYLWTNRNGISARTSNKDNEEFLKFLIPDVKSVPVNSFLALMSLFTIIIGPLNYFVLRRRKQLYMLVVTIPVIAFFTSLSLFAYSFVAHGFGVQSRVRSLTILNQHNNTAVTTSRLAFFAGMAPSDGLRFSPDTAVFPLWPRSGEFESGVVDWTEQQALKSGWLRSRTRTQFVTLSHRPERQRLEVGTPENNQLTVSNGFEWKIEALVVADEHGVLFVGNNLSAGGSSRLQQAKESDFTKIAKLLERYPLDAPERNGNNPFDFQFDRRRSSYYRIQFFSEIRFSNSLMERTLSRVKKQLIQDEKLPAHSYIAIFQENPNVELGIEDTVEQSGFHVLIGYY